MGPRREDDLARQLEKLKIQEVSALSGEQAAAAAAERAVAAWAQASGARDAPESPALSGAAAPSKAAITSLEIMPVSDLRRDTQHVGKLLYLVVESVSVADGTTITARDSIGAQVKVWSLISQPLGKGAGALVKGIEIGIKEPFYGKAPSGELCVRLDHPTDARLLVSESSSPDGYLTRGNAAFLKGRFLEATECYMNCIDHLTSAGRLDISELLQLKDVVLKRAHAYFKCGDFTSAANDAAYLQTDQNKQALKILVNSKAELGDWPAAIGAARSLYLSDTLNAENAKLHDRINARLSECAAGRYDFRTMVEQSRCGNGSVDIATYKLDIEKRKSPLGGDGIFAKSYIPRGAMLLCEKSFAITCPGDPRHAKDGIRDVAPGKASSGRKLALLQKVADRYIADPAHAAEVLTLCHGDGSQTSSEHTATTQSDQEPSPNTSSQQARTSAGGGQLVPTFDIRKGIRIINMNAHSTFPGPGSHQHDAHDPSHNMTPEDLRKHMHASADQHLGLWLTASRFNHSCVPNTHWSWIGDVLIVRAIQPIAPGEELTISYNPGLAHDRQQCFEEYGFTCMCELCKADEMATKQHKDACVTLQQQTRKFSSTRKDTSIPLRITEKSIFQAFLNVLGGYSRLKYFYNGLPAPNLAMPLVHLAHAMLGRTVGDWSFAGATKRLQAASILRSALAIGLQIFIIEDPHSAHCALVTGRYAAVRPAGIIALIGLAEVAFISEEVEEQKRCGPLKACAKELYSINYGEDVTFEVKHAAYACRAVDPVAALKPDEKRCEELEEGAKERYTEVVVQWVKEAAMSYGTPLPSGWIAEDQA